MKFAYADPPYPGRARRWYGEHPDYGGEVDHAELVGRLCRDYPDGWALSTNAFSLQYVLSLCPPGVRIAAWHNPRSQAPGGRRARRDRPIWTRGDAWWYAWEPVIICGGRSRRRLVRDFLAAPALGATGRFIGAKPPMFSRWVFGLLGAEPGDSLDDLFPGSGAVGKAWQEYASQPWMEPAGRRARPNESRRQMARTGEPSLLDVAGNTATCENRKDD